LLESLGFLRFFFSSVRSVAEMKRLRSITCGVFAVTKDIVSKMIPATGSLILKFLYRDHAIHSSGLTEQRCSALEHTNF
jgi:hypothetical protein